MVSKKKTPSADSTAAARRARKSRGNGTAAPRHVQPPEGRWIMLMNGRGRKRMVFEPKS